MNLDEIIQIAIKHHQSGNLQQAEYFYKEVLRAQPNNFYALQYLGVLNIQYKNYDSAIELIAKALQLNPDDANANYNLAIAFSGKGQIDKALTYYQKSIQLSPSNADAYVNLGIIYKAKEQLEEAVGCYHQALQLNPNHAAAYNNLGIAYKEKGQLDEAITSYQKALQLNPDSADIHLNLGTALQEKGRLDEAITSYQKALQLNPCLSEAYNNLGTAFMEQGKQGDALSSFDKALECNPNFLAARFTRCMAQLPIIYRSETEIHIARRLYREELVGLRESVDLKTSRGIDIASKMVGTVQPFYLAYQNLDDRELQQLYGSFVCKIMSLKYPEYAGSPPMPALLPGEPIRVGIISGYFHNHSVWKIPIRGWIQDLDRNRFDLYGYYTRTKRDDITNLARTCFKKFVEDVYSFEKLCQIIRSDNLHVLIYPEIGMDPMTIRMATLRLAPVQCVSWGHPDTSGLPTIDYYLSGDLIEVPEAADHYSEHLVRLPNLSINYLPSETSARTVNRDDFGLRSNSVIYHCCQSLFKFLPQNDKVFPLIARQVGDCQFIFSSDKRSIWLSNQFQLRIRQEFSKFNLCADDYVVFLPFLDEDQYNSLYNLSDTVLDPIGWSGCNTAFEAIAYNIPIVTLPGILMRSREVTAMLNKMDLAETIANSLDDYVSIAVKLGLDSEWRRQISGKMLHKKHLLYYDTTCVAALEDFIVKAIRSRHINQ